MKKLNYNNRILYTLLIGLTMINTTNIFSQGYTLLNENYFEINTELYTWDKTILFKDRDPKGKIIKSIDIGSKVKVIEELDLNKLKPKYELEYSQKGKFKGWSNTEENLIKLKNFNIEIELMSDMIMSFRTNLVKIIHENEKHHPTIFYYTPIIINVSTTQHWC